MSEFDTIVKDLSERGVAVKMRAHYGFGGEMTYIAEVSSAVIRHSNVSVPSFSFEVISNSMEGLVPKIGECLISCEPIIKEYERVRDHEQRLFQAGVISRRTPVVLGS